MRRLAIFSALFALFAVTALFVTGCGRSGIGDNDVPSLDGSVDTPTDTPTDGPTGCNSDVDCHAPTPHCRTDVHVCVECITTPQCPTGDVCKDFKCVGACGAGGTCPSGLACCEAFCVDTTSATGDCGGCGINCGPYSHATPACTSSACAIGKCDVGFADCDRRVVDGCEVNVESDPTSCGGCGRACAPGETCSGGVCVGGCGPGGVCPPGQACCATRCANTSSDPNNCGACGKSCGSPPHASVACGAGTCGITSCAFGFADCNGVYSDGCEVNLETDPTHCGSCPTSCPTGEACSGGVCAGPCGTSGCPAGLTCCKATCDNLASDVNNCGGCGNVCPPEPNATPTCTASKCAIGSCNPGFADCDLLVGDGCEIDTRSDPTNCGSCGHACPPGSACVGGICSTPGCGGPGGPTCPPGLSCCGTSCVDESRDNFNCGGCSIACKPGTSCTGGSCAGGCNGGPACIPGQTCCPTGCADTTSDPLHCGGCATACGAPPHSTATCSASTCSFVCNKPFGDCDGIPSDGCEANLDNDPANCGACGKNCGPGGKCTGGTCSAICACPAPDICCPAPTGPCVDPTNDPNNCGGCGTTCASHPNSVPTCTTGACSYACVGAFLDCNGLASDGCEIDGTSDPSNCGGCGTTCPTGETCAAGVCSGGLVPFDPIVNPTFLSPGIHVYSSINVPAGVVVYVAGAGPASGTLDLRATGDILINGTIDVSGGPGSQNTITSSSTSSGKAGSGGYTGEVKTAPFSLACQFVVGNPGPNGSGPAGTIGTCPAGPTTCIGPSDPLAILFAAPAATYGGGAGVFTGYRAYGSGGGGPGGGAPGSAGAAYSGESDCSGTTGGGGATSGAGGKATGAPYDGVDGVLGQTQCAGLSPGVPPAFVGGGGGGSIGGAAALDLAVTTTFIVGSGGGGGSSDYLNRPVYGGTSGGGGGGGALKLSSPTSIVVNGQLLANGGDGGDAFIGNGAAAGCDPQPGAAGGGGSGGVIYLSAPTITVGKPATISAAGGVGGFGSVFATGGGGGNGGLGRIRLSVTPASCSLSGTMTPPLSSGCTPTTPAVPGRAYVGTYPG